MPGLAIQNAKNAADSAQVVGNVATSLISGAQAALSSKIVDNFNTAKHIVSDQRLSDVKTLAAKLDFESLDASFSAKLASKPLAGAGSALGRANLLVGAGVSILAVNADLQTEGIGSAGAPQTA
jgi:hypothetical protein